MAVYTQQQYQQLQRRRIKSLRNLKRRTPLKIAEFMTAQLRLMSPRSNRSSTNYPHMYQTIRRRGTQVSVSGVNPNTGFPYVHWVNATPGMGLDKVRLFGGRSVSYAQVAKTGTPGFFWVAQDRTRVYGRKLVLTALRNVLRGTV